MSDKPDRTETMDALSDFAAAISHDINNVLGAIEGYTAIILPSLEEGTLKDDIMEIRKAGQRGADLTRLMMTFARRQKMAPAPLDLAELARAIREPMLKILGDAIKMRLELPEGKVPAICDRSRIEQVLLQLACNAKDAMPEGGEVELSVRTEVCDSTVPDGSALSTGKPCAVILMRDTGSGMDQETLRKAMYPFFTTKTRAKGAGMGLAIAYAMARQHGGDISLESSEGKGTAVTIRLPAAESLPEASAPSPAGEERPAGPALLIVEDDIRLRTIVCKALNAGGFRVDCASTLHEALAMFKDRSGAYDVVFADIILPDGRSDKSIPSFLEINPKVQLVFTTGHLQDSPVAEEAEATGRPLIEKPYDIRKLAELFRKLTESRRS